MFGVSKVKFDHLGWVVSTLRGMLEDRTNALRERVRLLEEKPMPDIVTCEVCGCAVVKGKAYKGKPEIRFGVHPVPYDFVPHGGPYAHVPMLCKQCAGMAENPPATLDAAPAPLPDTPMHKYKVFGFGGALLDTIEAANVFAREGITFVDSNGVIVAHYAVNGYSHFTQVKGEQ